MNHPDTQVPVTVRVFTQRFSATPRATRLARLLALGQLDAWDVPYGSGASDAAAVIVAELTANAVLHARVPGRGFELRLLLTGVHTLRIEVTDTRADRRPEQSPTPAPDAESGRGLTLVEALATSWGVTDGPAPRKTVWAELTLRPGPT
ncbi:ATP-binding protein [Streptomyces sporangiiformans]|uniref:ATP-binding protein n=1 Tax=Streptomyces sporangiiformans TaxID=2315329 RepID=A0A505D8V7_9ACTN|nr:ATP-binding protein [Streptomyces sporangiiformans]TPQ20144.1 ATP-binding protein [Streptomyces sporangiiformans]